ncbi:MAG: glycosyltransferase family A protein [Bacteroidales bacterium]
MKWYNKYLSVFETPIDEVPLSTIDEIRTKLKSKQSPNPIASVVVIAYNEEKHLLSCLWSLAETNTKFPIEIIGIDNDSSDRTVDIFKILGMPYFIEYNKSQGNARNRGQQEAKGDYYLCIDSDTMYPPGYIDMHLKQLMKPGVAASYSFWSYVPDKDYPRIWMFFYELFRDIHLIIQSIKRPELSVRGMTFAYNIHFGKKIGFRLDIKRGEDGSLALGLKKFGKIKLIANKNARVMTCTSTLKQDGSMFNAFKIRALKGLRHLGDYFVKKDLYKDDESNLVK